jgi:hypothetical protein
MCWFTVVALQQVMLLVELDVLLMNLVWVVCISIWQHQTVNILADSNVAKVNCLVC